MLQDLIAEHIVTQDADPNAASRSSKLVRLARLGRFARLARLAKISHLRKTTKTINTQLRTVGVSKPQLELFGRILFLSMATWVASHVIACLWTHQARMSQYAGDLLNWYDVEYRSVLGEDGWPFDGKINDTELARSVAKKDEHGVSVKQAGHWESYWAAVYYSVLTMFSVGYGDNCRPFSTDERIISLWVIILGTFLAAWIKGSFTASLLSMGRHASNYDAMLRGVSSYLKYNEVPFALEDKIIQYFEYKFASKTMFVEDALSEMPARIQADYLLHRFRKIIHLIPFFRGCREDAIVAIVTRMNSYSALPTQYIYHKGEMGRDLIILMKGRVASVHEGAGQGNQDTIEGSDFKRGAFFGENEFLGFSAERSETLRARTFVEVSMLHPDDMVPVFEMHLALRRRFENYARLKQKLSSRLQQLEGGTLGDKPHEVTEVEFLAELKRIKDEIDQDGGAASDAVAVKFADLAVDGAIDLNGVARLAASMGRNLKTWELQEAMLDMVSFYNFQATV